MQSKTVKASAALKNGVHALLPHVSRLLHLKRTAGNQVVRRLLQSGVLQAKLRVSRPGDISGKEADRTAEQVMRMPEPWVQRQPEDEEIQNKTLADQITPLVQMPKE